MLCLASPVSRAVAVDLDDQAQQLFAAGVDAARLDHWEEARRHFEEAYHLAPRLVVLINLASARARTGLLVEAVDSYHRVLESSPSPENAEFRRAASEVLPSLEARLPRIQVNPKDLGPSDVVKIDGEALDRAQMGQAHPIDPGQHAMTVERGGLERARIAFSVAEGETHDISLPAQVLAAPLPPTDSNPTGVGVAIDHGAPNPSAGRAWWKSPWFWGATTTAVIAGVVSFVLFEDRPREFSGNVPPGVVKVP